MNKKQSQIHVKLAKVVIMNTFINSAIIDSKKQNRRI